MKRIIYISIVLGLFAWVLSCKFNLKNVHKKMDKQTEKALMNTNMIETYSDSNTIYLPSIWLKSYSKDGFVHLEYSTNSDTWKTLLVLPFEKTKIIHDTIYIEKKKKKQIYYEEPAINSGCDSAAKAFNVMYWKTQCEFIRKHNETTPENSWYMPQLSEDSCIVTFPL